MKSDLRSSMIKIVVLLTALPLLLSCAMMSDDRCRSADWHQIGFDDGVQGKPVSQALSYRSECSIEGITPILSSYIKGRSEGLVKYCKPITGYQLGRRGGSYNGVCPAELSGEFVAAYRYGKEIYTMNIELTALKGQLLKAEDEAVLIHRMIKQKDKNMAGANVPIMDRIRLLKEIKSMNRGEQRDTESRIEDLQRKIDSLRNSTD